MPFTKNLNTLNTATDGNLSSATKSISDDGYNSHNLTRLQPAPELAQTERTEIEQSSVDTQTAYLNKETNIYGLTKPCVPSGPEYPDYEVSMLIVEKMWRVVCTKNLFAFYTQTQLQNLVNRTCKHDYKILKRDWGFQLIDSITDLCVVALYDVIVVCDDSGSMHYFEKTEGTKRWDILKAIVKTITFFGTLLDDNGIDLMFLNYPEVKRGVKSFSEVEKLFTKISPSGSDPIGYVIRERIFNNIVLPYLNPESREKLSKPLLVLNVTDGLPVDKPDINTAILRCRDLCGRSKYGENAMAFAFAQAGKDKTAADWLKEIDRDPQIGHLIDCTSEFDMEQAECGGPSSGFNEATWMLKLMVGAILPFYDKADESDVANTTVQTAQPVQQIQPTQSHGHDSVYVAPANATNVVSAANTTNTASKPKSKFKGILGFFGLK